jgi:hypothetical protein
MTTPSWMIAVDVAFATPVWGPQPGLHQVKMVRLSSTATPLSYVVGELWSIIVLLSPGTIS